MVPWFPLCRHTHSKKRWQQDSASEQKTQVRSSTFCLVFIFLCDSMMVFVGTVETRVPRAGLPGPITSSENFTKDQALQAWRDSRACRGLDRGSHDKGSRQGLVEAPTSLSKICSLQASSASGRAHMGSALPAESRARQSAMTTALQLPF